MDAIDNAYDMVNLLIRFKNKLTQITLPSLLTAIEP